jgi:hypothetical protein
MAELYVDSQLKKNVNYAESIQWTDSTKLNLTKHNWTEESKRKKKKEFRKKKKMRILLIIDQTEMEKK